ncbi:cyclic 3',5'-adenosine monophosphate phosphodiesterase [Salmonella enterica subsp. enterica]|uniref:Cyclic 3',5'-adenosine monophosphate phosphodiesterase n=1 Tax=Salmonella enterica I TaxID=59201 RepID=A0A379UV78_SALET|nr:cyclic 3',5'-adenosine monophosphate phosphodiesterase [Salmonella enterica subsp. enterica]
MLIGEQWQILLLDSQVFGVPHGELSEFQLEWLERKLADAPERQTLLLLHHHPLPAGCSWLDQHSLRNAGELDSVLANFPRVKYLLCGHIHQELDLDWNGRRLLASPSTCVQFKPHCANFTLDTIAPGWRTLELRANGVLETEVHRLQDTRFRPIPLRKDTDVYASLFARIQQFPSLGKSVPAKKLAGGASSAC